jgi:hypothetical protein
MHEFPHPKNRVRNIVESALIDCSYVSSEREGTGGTMLLKARRSDGKGVSVRFRGVRESDATSEPERGAPLRVVKVGNGNRFNLISTLFPILKPPGPPHARVTIQAGTARLDIVCQDAEWWEDEAPPD